jgi:hypothetical protein
MEATQGRLATIIAVPRQAVWSSGGSLKHMKGSTRRSRDMKADRALSISDRQHQSARAICSRVKGKKLPTATPLHRLLEDGAAPLPKIYHRLREEPGTGLRRHRGEGDHRRRKEGGSVVRERGEGMGGDRWREVLTQNLHPTSSTQQAEQASFTRE